jgi:hypothetical protein
MTDADRESFGFLIVGLGAAFGMEIDEAALEGYWLVLEDLDLAAIKAAAREVARQVKFMPRASQIRDVVLETRDRALREQERRRRLEQYKAAVVEGIREDAFRLNWTEDQFHQEILRVGSNMNLVLPRQPLVIECKERDDVV